MELKDTLNRTWRDDTSNFGYKMLQKMGWTEEAGLGANEDGITENVKLKRRAIGQGLGVDDNDVGEQGWSHTAKGFNSILSTLKNKYGSPAKKKSKTKGKRAAIKVGMK
jgi:Pin2-interacting protein X1